MICTFTKETAIVLAKMSEEVFEFHLCGLKYKFFFPEITGARHSPFGIFAITFQQKSDRLFEIGSRFFDRLALRIRTGKFGYVANISAFVCFFENCSQS